MSIEVLRGGVLTTVQDLGRNGMQHLGVPVSGAMDTYSMRIANHLVGNKPEEAVLELTLVGPTLEFHEDMLIALCGADLSPTVDGVALPLSRPVWVYRGSRLAFGRCVSGCRSYLAFAGGLDIPKVLGSRSTYVRAAIGGIRGRALRAGDRLSARQFDRERLAKLKDSSRSSETPFFAPRWSAQSDLQRFQRRPQQIRFVSGAHWERLTPEAQSLFTTKLFEIGSASDRMGYRLEGAMLEASDGGTIASEAVAFGTVQLPPDGKPIVLMADRQTIGGYPRIGEVATVDLPLLAQLKAGDEFAFRRVSLHDAQQLAHVQSNAIARMRESIQMRM